MDEKKKHKQIKLVLDNENQIEEYANFAVATHSPAEFVIDFLEYYQVLVRQKLNLELLCPQYI